MSQTFPKRMREVSQFAATNPYASYQPVAIIGMKADSMEDDVETFACDVNPIGFGLVVGRVAPHSKLIMPGGADPIGISVHDHIVGSRGSYLQYDAVSVMTRGRIWCKVSDGTNVDDGVYACYDPATGEVNTTGTAIPNAVFRTIAMPLPDTSQFIVSGGAPTMLGAIVEMHYPLALPPGP